MSARIKTIKIKNAEHVVAHKLALFFSDGKQQVVDFGPFLQNSLHPEIRKYLRPKKFKQFAIENGELMWGDFDLVFPVMDLYENKLDRKRKSVRSATA